MGDVISTVQAVRGWRDGAGVKPGAFLPARPPANLRDGARALVARLARLEWTEDGDAAASVPVPGGVVEILASDIVDPAAEAAKRDTRIAELRKEIDRAQSKLANQGFIAKAPEAVVGAERDKLGRLQAELSDLEAS